MADLDTRAKRSSGMLPGMVWRAPAVNPSGGVTQPDRQAIAGTYSAIEAENPAPVTFIAAWAAGSNVILGSIA